MKVLQNNNRPTFGALLTSLVLVGCGGSSGSSIEQLANNIENSGGVVITDQNVSSCAQDLREVINASNSGLLTLQNLSSGCDYLVDGSINTSGVNLVEAGVTFVLTAGSELSFRGVDVEIQGTSASPVRFQAEQGAAPWGHVDFTRENSTLNNVLFSGGGATSNSSFNEPAMVFINSEESEINNSSFIGSSSIGLVLTSSGSRVDDFQINDNTFSGNASYGLSTGSGVISFLNNTNDFAGSDNPNGEIGVLVDSSFWNGQIAANINTPYVLGQFSDESGEIFSISDTLFEAGVSIVVPDGNNIEAIDVVFNGTVSEPIEISSSADSVSGWGSLNLERDNEVRNIILNNGGSVEGGFGAAVFLGSVSRSTGFGNLNNIENISISNSGSYGVICNSGDTTAYSIAGFVGENSTLGDIHPNCDISQLPVVADSESRDASECAEAIVASSASTLERAVFANTDAACDFYIVGELEVRSPSGSVTIASGTSFLFAPGASLNINGALIAQGTENDHIQFRGEQISDGFWNGISLENGISLLEYVNIEDGGTNEVPALFLEASGSPFTFTSERSTSLIEVSVSGSNGDGVVVDNAMTLSGFSNNSFIGNARSGLVVPIEQAVMLDSGSLYDSVMAPNGRPGIRLGTSSGFDVASISRGDVVLSDIALWSSPGISVGTLGSLTLTEGVTINFDEETSLSRSIASEGSSITIVGTMLNPVTLTGPADNPTNWRGVSAGNLEATYLTIVGGGVPVSETEPLASGGAIVISRSANVTLNNVTLQDSRGWGIDCVSGEATIELENVTFDNTALGNFNPMCGT